MFYSENLKSSFGILQIFQIRTNVKLSFLGVTKSETVRMSRHKKSEKLKNLIYL